MLVTRQRELRAQAFGVEFFALGKKERERGEIRRRRHPIERGGRRNQEHVALAARHVIERGEALGHQILMGGKLIVGQRFPVRKHADAQRRREPGHFRGEPLHGERIGADDREQLALRGRLRRPLGKRERIG